MGICELYENCCDIIRATYLNICSVKKIHTILQNNIILAKVLAIILQHQFYQYLLVSNQWLRFLVLGFRLFCLRLTKMFSITFYAQLKHHLKLSSYCAALPFYFNTRTGRVTMMTSRWAILLHKVELGSTLIYTILQCVMTLTSSYPETNKYIAMVFISVYGTGLGLRFSWTMDPVPMEFMNSLMQYERQLLDGKFFCNS